MLHCRTLKHVASLYGVDEADLQKAGRKTPAREGGDNYYKAVAVAEKYTEQKLGGRVLTWIESQERRKRAKASAAAE